MKGTSGVAEEDAQCYAESGVSKSTFYPFLKMCALFSRKLQPVDVLVAGGGPVGLFTALRLAQRGMSVVLAEQSYAPASHSYALALHPTTLALFEQARLDDLTRDARLLHRMAFYDTHACRAALSLGDKDSATDAVAVLGQDVLETRLAAALEEAGVTVLWRHRVAALRQESDHVMVEVQRLGEQGHAYAVFHNVSVVESSQDIKARYVIGCDGHGSTVRQQLGIRFEEVGPVEVYAVAEIETDKPLPAEIRVVMDGDESNVLWPMPGQRCRWSFQLGKGAAPYYSRTKERGLFDFGDEAAPVLTQAALKALVEERAPWFDDDLKGIRWRKCVRFEKRMASRMGSGRVWLAGDAAHMGWPLGVQSMNMGFAEGEALAEAVAREIQQGDKMALEHAGPALRAHWDLLLNGMARIHPTADAEPWVREHAERIFHTLPATAESLPRLLDQLGLELERAVPITAKSH